MLLALLLLTNPPATEPVMVLRMGGAIQVYLDRDGWRYYRQLPATATDDEVQAAARALTKPVEVPAPVFRGPAVHAGHHCPNCGRSQYVIAGWNADGTHTHVCPTCRTSWRH